MNKAHPTEQKTDRIVKKTTPLPSTTKKKEIAKVIVTKTDEKSKSTPQVKVNKSVRELATSIIIRHEGKLHLCAFKDHTRYSIGYGTISFKGECISKQGALDRFGLELGSRIDLIEKNLPKLETYQKAALVSLKYNCNSCYARAYKTLKEGKEITINDFIRWKMVGTKYKNGLLTRAKNELALFNLGVIY